VIFTDYDKWFEKTIIRQNDYNEEDVLKSKINRSIKINNVLQLSQSQDTFRLKLLYIYNKIKIFKYF
jgi:hypothetical protein